MYQDTDWYSAKILDMDPDSINLDSNSLNRMNPDLRAELLLQHELSVASSSPSRQSWTSRQGAADN